MSSVEDDDSGLMFDDDDIEALKDQPIDVINHVFDAIQAFNNLGKDADIPATAEKK